MPLARKGEVLPLAWSTGAWIRAAGWSLRNLGNHASCRRRAGPWNAAERRRFAADTPSAAALSLFCPRSGAGIFWRRVATQNGWGRACPGRSARPSPNGSRRCLPPVNQDAVRPPSMTCSMPLMYEESSQARKRTRFETSLGSAMRRSGTWSAMPPPVSSVAAAIIGVLM